LRVLLCIRRNFYQRNLFGPALIFLGWTLYGLFFASQAYIQQAFIGKNATWQNNLGRWLICAYLWALLTPLILVLAAGFPFARRGWLSALPVHLVASAALSLFQLALYSFVHQLIFGPRQGSWFDRYQGLVVEEVHAGILIYFSILAVSYVRHRFFTPTLDFRFSHADKAFLKHSQYDQIRSSKGSGNGVIARPAPLAYVSRIPVKENGRIIVVNARDIDWINSEGNYVKVHTAGKRYMIRETMNSIERKLDPTVFVRIRRSTIVRVEQISELRPTVNGEFDVVLKSGASVSSSRRYRQNLDFLLKS
jgi:hypothetical protein